MPASIPVDVKMRTAKVHWDRETPEVKAAVEEKREANYQRDLKQYNELLDSKREQGREYTWCVFFFIFILALA